MLKIMHLCNGDFVECTGTCRKMTVCYDSTEGKVGMSFTHPNDRFVKKIGREVAQANMKIDCPKNLSKKELFAYLEFLRVRHGYFPDSWRRDC